MVARNLPGFEPELIKLECLIYERLSRWRILTFDLIKLECCGVVCGF